MTDSDKKKVLVIGGNTNLSRLLLGELAFVTGSVQAQAEDFKIPYCERDSSNIPKDYMPFKGPKSKKRA